MVEEILVKTPTHECAVGYIRTYIVLEQHVNFFGKFKYIYPFRHKNFSFYRLYHSLKRLKIHKDSNGDVICSGGFISFLDKENAEKVATQLAHKNNGLKAFSVIECVIEHGSKYAVGYNEHFKTECILSNRIRLLTLLSAIK